MGELEGELNAFRAELERESVAAASIDELVEHLREIVDARVAAGDDVASAIQTARDRLGDPKSLARECARVRSTFGPKPSRSVAWLLVGLIATFYALVLGINVQIAQNGQFRIAIIIVIALALRSPHAVAFVLGCAASTSLWLARAIVYLWGDWWTNDEARSLILMLALSIAVIVLIAKSTRLTRASLGLAALGFALYGTNAGALGEWALTYVRELELLGNLLIGIAIAMTAFRLPGAWFVCLACAAIGLPYVQYIAGHHPNGQPYVDLYEAIRTNIACVVAPIVAAIAMRRQSRPFADALRRNGPTAAA